MFTRGIWKSVYLVETAPVAIEYLVPEVMYDGAAWPVTPWADGDANFTVRATVHVYAAAATAGTLLLEGAWGAAISKMAALVVGHNTITVTLAATGPALWWPSGMGKQRMYELNATFTPAIGAAVRTGRRIGFRLAAFVTVCPYLRAVPHALTVFFRPEMDV